MWIVSRPRRWRWWSAGNQLQPYSSDTIASSASRQPLLTAKCRRQFLQACWGVKIPDTGEERQLRAYDSYLRHYEESCTLLPLRYPSLDHCTHEIFCNAIQSLHQGTRQECETRVESILPLISRSPAAARDAIDFVGNAILLIDLSTWSADEAMLQFTTRVLATSSTQKDQYRIPVHLNARTFHQVAGIKILWTRNLLSHLELASNDSTLALFHNVQVLHLYEQSQHLSTIFPPTFLDETHRTLSLMLPVANKRSKKWFRSEQRRLNLDPAAGECRHLRAPQRNIQDFDFWRDRLIIMKEAFDLSQPSGIMQLWRDDRNKAQWFTFWIAVVVFVLTLIGVVEGALQVYKAYYPSML